MKRKATDSHADSAVGTPTLAVFTATDPHVWRPLGDNITTMDARSGILAVHADILNRIKDMLSQANS